MGYMYSGSDDLDDVAWFDDNGGERTHAVKEKKPNELGLYDMSGNVREWCNDWYAPYVAESQRNPEGPKEGTERVLRGGGWSSTAPFLRVHSATHLPQRKVETASVSVWHCPINVAFPKLISPTSMMSVPLWKCFLFLQEARASASSAKFWSLCPQSFSMH